MAHTKNSLEHFYQYAESNNYLSDELSLLLINDKVKNEFFELCKKFEDIPLNSEKFAGDETGTVTACFKFTDINRAKEAAKSFYRSYQISDIDSYIESIHNLYPIAIEDNDQRQKSGMIRNNDINYSLGYYGTYFNFRELPEDEWIKLSSQLKEYLIND